jgi:hypothetical protein
LQPNLIGVSTKTTVSKFAMELESTIGSGRERKGADSTSPCEGCAVKLLLTTSILTEKLSVALTIQCSEGEGWIRVRYLLACWFDAVIEIQPIVRFKLQRDTSWLSLNYSNAAGLVQDTQCKESTKEGHVCHTIRSKSDEFRVPEDDTVKGMSLQQC